MWVAKQTGRRNFRLLLVATLIPVLVVTSTGDDALGDGFVDKLVKFDGKLSKGKLDDNKSLNFFGQGKWRAPLTVRFSLFVRTHFELVPFIETEARGILGEYTVTFTVVPKTRGASHQNLRVKILDRDGNELVSSGVAARNGSGWVIGIATEQEPSDIHISYSPEKAQELTPVSSQEGNPS